MKVAPCEGGSLYATSPGLPNLCVTSSHELIDMLPFDNQRRTFDHLALSLCINGMLLLRGIYD